jgi:hypothetical protein
VIAQFNDATEGKGTVRDWLADLLLKKLESCRRAKAAWWKSASRDPTRSSWRPWPMACGRIPAPQHPAQVEPMKKVSVYFDDQTKAARYAGSGQSRLSKYQQEHGIVSVDNRLDVESNRLNDLSAQLVLAQGQSMEASRASAWCRRLRFAGRGSQPADPEPARRSGQC